MNTIIMSACPVCGDESPAAQRAVLEYSTLVDGAEACQKCAGRIANAYSKKHSGVWLTYPESQTPPPKKARISATLRTQVFERDRYCCLRCDSHMNLRADHVIPESQGGETAAENLQTLCLPCNSWKGIKTIDFRRSGEASS